MSLLSFCSLHPSAFPFPGICPSCLRERLQEKNICSENKKQNIRRLSCEYRHRTSLENLFKADLQNRHTQTKDEEENTKPIKDLIEEEIKNTNNRQSLWESGLAKKLHKWRRKQQKTRKETINQELFRKESGSKTEWLVRNEKVVGRRRSCDTDTRFETEENTNRLLLEEPRASWDGYMTVRNIPRTAPMLSVIESARKEEEEEIVVEEEMNSISESSSSARRNSFDFSSSGKSSSMNRMHAEIDDLKAKVVDTGHLEMDLDVDRSKRSVSAAQNPDSLKKKVLRILGLKSKSAETRDIREKQIGGGDRDANEVSSGKVLGRNSYSYHRSLNVAHASTFDRTRSVRYSPSPINFENGLLRFHLTPQLPLSRKKKPERRSALNLQTSARGVS